MPPVSVSLTDNLKDRLNEYCRDYSLARSSVITKLLEAYLNGDISLDQVGVPSPQTVNNNNQVGDEEVERLQAEIAEKTRIIEALQLENLEKDRQLISTPDSIDEESVEDDLSGFNSIVKSNQLCIAQMMRERTKLYAILATQRNVIELLKQERNNTPVTLSKAEEEKPQGRVIVWHPTNGIRLEMQLVPGLNVVPTSRVFGILRSCVDVLETETQLGETRNNVREQTLLLAKEEMLAASKNPSHKVKDDIYNRILDEVADRV